MVSLPKKTKYNRLKNIGCFGWLKPFGLWLKLIGKM
jgi:hypothetical protein